MHLRPPLLREVGPSEADCDAWAKDPLAGTPECAVAVLAAHRAGIKRVILPERNTADLEEVPDEIKNELEFVPVKKMDEVLANALTEPDELQLDLSDESGGKSEESKAVQPTP